MWLSFMKVRLTSNDLWHYLLCATWTSPWRSLMRTQPTWWLQAASSKDLSQHQATLIHERAARAGYSTRPALQGLNVSTQRRAGKGCGPAWGTAARIQKCYSWALCCKYYFAEEYSRIGGTVIGWWIIFLSVFFFQKCRKGSYCLTVGQFKLFKGWYSSFFCTVQLPLECTLKCCFLFQ